MDESSALDLNVVEELRSLDGDDEPAFFAHLVDQFIAEGGKGVNGIREAVAHRDPAAVANFAHSLKGSSGSLGAVRVASVSAELVVRSRSGKVEELASLASRLEHEYQRACKALRAQVGGWFISPGGERPGREAHDKKRKRNRKSAAARRGH